MSTAVKADSPADNKTLDALITAIAEGNMDPLEELYRLTATPVHSFALSILRNRHDAEDVLHDCYLSIVRSAGSYRSHGKPMAWILTIARNLSLSKLRESGRESSLDDENAGEYEAPADAVDVEEKMLLEACLNQLGEQERQIVTLHLTAGFKHREIASLLELPLSTVLSKYHRALKKLRAMVA
jgi:RNA polymerase sigma factor, sigma-70 family